MYNFRKRRSEKIEDNYDTSGPIVTLIAVNRSGSGFATISLLKWFGDENYIPKLQFWSYNHNDQSIDLTTEIHDLNK